MIQPLVKLEFVRRYCDPRDGWAVFVDIDASEGGRTGSPRESKEAIARQELMLRESPRAIAELQRLGVYVGSRKKEWTRLFGRARPLPPGDRDIIAVHDRCRLLWIIEVEGDSGGQPEGKIYKALGQLVCAASEMRLPGFTQALSLVAWGEGTAKHLKRAAAIAALGVSALVIAEDRKGTNGYLVNLRHFSHWRRADGSWEGARAAAIAPVCHHPAPRRSRGMLKGLSDQDLNAYEDALGSSACVANCGWQPIAQRLLWHVRNGPTVPAWELHAVVAAFQSETEASCLCQSSTCFFREMTRNLRLHALDRAARQAALEGYKRSGYLASFTARLESACAPVIYRARSGKRHNGTMTFLDTGDATLGLTAAHVVEALQRECSDENPCQVGSGILPLGTLVGCHPVLDLAAFRFSPEFVTDLGKKPMVADQWPPAALEDGEVIAFAGYPGCERREVEGRFDMGFLFSLTKAQCVSDTGFGGDMAFRTSFSADESRFAEDASLGGWSGGPVFRLKKVPIDEPELVGIIYCGPFPGLAQAHLLSSLRPDGAFE